MKRTISIGMHCLSQIYFLGQKICPHFSWMISIYLLPHQRSQDKSASNHLQLSEGSDTDVKARNA
jgi:hypothetical protein